MTGPRKSSASLRAVIMKWKHSSIVAGAITIFGQSPGEAYSAAIRSPCSILVGKSGGRSAALHHHHDQRNFGHHREAQELGLERETRTRSDRDRRLAGVGTADGETDGGDLVFRLVNDATRLFDRRSQEVRGRGGRRDGVHGADFDPRRHDPRASAWLPFITTMGR
jgi:hypothetical protein